MAVLQDGHASVPPELNLNNNNKLVNKIKIYNALYFVFNSVSFRDLVRSSKLTPGRETGN